MPQLLLEASKAKRSDLVCELLWVLSLSFVRLLEPNRSVVTISSPEADLQPHTTIRWLCNSTGTPVVTVLDKCILLPSQQYYFILDGAQ